MKSLKFIFYSLPWIMVIILFLIWVIGIEFPSRSKDNKIEVINNTIILEKIEELGRLELVRYNYREIFDYKALSEGKIRGTTALRSFDYKPDLKVVLIARGEAVGCIDLRKMRDQDIMGKGDTLILRLPDPELCYYKLDHENTRIYDFERSGWWSMLFSDDEEMSRVIDGAYREAEIQIRKAALENGILEQTSGNAEHILKPLLEGMTGKSVLFVYAPSSQSITPEK